MTEPKPAPQDAKESESAPSGNGLNESSMPASAAPMPEEPSRLEPQYFSGSVSGQWVREWMEYADTTRARCEELQRENGRLQERLDRMLASPLRKLQNIEEGMRLTVEDQAKWDAAVQRAERAEADRDNYKAAATLHADACVRLTEQYAAIERDRATLAAAVRDAITQPHPYSPVLIDVNAPAGTYERRWCEKHAEALRLAREIAAIALAGRVGG